jgi:hypothetical protein
LARLDQLNYEPLSFNFGKVSESNFLLFGASDRSMARCLPSDGDILSKLDDDAQTKMLKDLYQSFEL